MAEENPSWGEGALLTNCRSRAGIFVDSRTIGKYMKHGGVRASRFG
jgi:hypothetical protein